MNTIARVLSPLAFGLFYVASVACSAPEVQDDLDRGSKSKASKDDFEDEEGTELPKSKKSDDSAQAPTPAPAPSSSSSSDPAPAPAPTPPPDSKPAVDPMACTNLGKCCQNIDNVIGRISCLAVQAKGDPDTCSKSLIGCEAATGLGGGSSGSSGGSARCYDDYDCPGVQLCYSGTCR